MKFGEYEDFRKRVEQQRKEEYRSELEKVRGQSMVFGQICVVMKICQKISISLENLFHNPTFIHTEMNLWFL